MPWRVLVVDDSAFMRKAITEMVASDNAFEVVGTARDGQDALIKLAQLKPDLMTLDVEMPNLNGLDTLRKMRDLPKTIRPRVLMCSSLTSEGSRAALTALSLGAVDCVAKDASVQLTGLDELRKDVLEKLHAIAPGPPPPAVPVIQHTTPFVPPPRVDLLAVGSSTGGPPVIEKMVLKLPAGMSFPVLIAQHMPAAFTRSLAERLGQLGSAKVVHASAGVTPMEPGHVYLIEGGLNGHVISQGRGLAVEVKREPLTAIYRPSVNVLFETAAKTSGKNTLGVVYTGMGDDGLVGARDLIAAGGKMLAQDRESSVVYGMPRAVADAGLATSMTPDEISRVIANLERGARKSA